MYRIGRISLWLVVALACLPIAAQTSDSVPEALYDPRELEMRDRYEQTLLRDPFQEQSFKKVYESYLTADGLTAWIEKLLKPGEGSEAGISEQILLGRIRHRQFKTDEARAHLEQAKEMGEDRPDFNILLGTVLYQSGRDDAAIELLSGALDGIAEAEKRGRVCRMLGNLYLRQGKRSEAIDVWKRLIDQGSDDPFAYQELAEIYQDNLMWEEAIGVYERIAERATDDPYTVCKSLRSIGGCQIQLEQHEAAIATYEKGLEMVAPGNWLFEDLKLRLVSVYQDLGDLEGLSRYLIEKIEAVPSDIEFRDLLAETYTRMGSLELAETEYRAILERNPGKTDTYEKLIALSVRMEKPDRIETLFDELIAQYPTEPDYFRRLGEHYLGQRDSDKAKATWARVLEDDPTAGTLALLAEWHESYEYIEEAIAFYNRALELRPNTEWTYRVGALTYELGRNEDALAIWLSVVPPDSERAEDYAECSALIQSYGFYEEAEPLWKKAIALEPEQSEYRVALAKNFLVRDAYDDALGHFQALAEDGANAYFRGQGERGVLDVYTQSGVLQEKLAEWKAAADAAPESAELKVKLARLYERLRNRTEATNLYRQAVELEPENAEYLHILARAQETTKQFDDAIETYNRLLELDKNRAGGYYRELLDLLMRQGRKDEAIETAKAIVELTPSDPEARTSLAQVYTQFDEREEALQQLRYALRLESSEPDYYQQYGMALEGLQRLGEAQDAYRKMLDAATENQTRLQAVGHLARVYLQQGRIDELTTEFQARARNTPKKISAYDELASVHRDSGNIKRALEVMEDAYGNVDDKETALRNLVRESYNAQDFNKVVKYYEQLLAMFGNPSMFELERLGRVYAQLGDLDTARATWGRITKTNPDDPYAYEVLAKALKSEGFMEESLAETAHSIALDPKNHRLRFAYAQDLAAMGKMDEATEQLRELLEEGDRETAEAKETTAAEKKPPRRIGRSIGGFEQLRPQVLQSLVQLAMNSTGLDDLLEAYREKRELNPEDEQVTKDLVILYQMARRFEDLLALHQEALARNEEDLQALMNVARTYQSMRDFDNALTFYERIWDLHPDARVNTVRMLGSIHVNNGEPEKAEALYTALLEEKPDDMNLLQLTAGMYQQRGEFELARAMHDRIEKIDPNTARNLRHNSANQLRQRGDYKQANELLADILFDDTFAAQSGGRKGNPALYVPMPSNRNFLQAQRFMNDLNVLGFQLQWDQYIWSAFSSLVISPTSETARDETIARVAKLAREHQNADASKDRQRGQVMALLFIGSYIVRGDYEGALGLVEEFQDSGKVDAAWGNLRLYLLAQEERYDEMLEHYETLAPLYASRPEQMQRAKAHMFHAMGEKEKARELFEAMAKKTNSPQQFMAAVQEMINLGYTEESLALLEDHLAGTSRNQAALTTLARMYRQAGDNERAYELGKEVWESNKGRRRGRSGGYSTRVRQQFGYYGGGGFARGGSGQYRQIDGNLAQYFNYAQGAGKADELVDEFKALLEQNPASVRAHTDLAALYQLTNQPDKQIEVFRLLTEKRPNDANAKLAIAQIYQRQGDSRSALDVYEELIASRPAAARDYLGQIRNLYQQLGDFQAMAEFDEQSARRANTQQELQNLAQQWTNTRKYDQAITIYRKLLNRNPRQSEQYNSQIAHLLQQAGRLEEALKAYETWLGSAGPGQRSVDANLGRWVALYSSLGRLDEFKERNAKDLVERPNEPRLIALDAYMAKEEGRIDDALTGFDRLRQEHGMRQFHSEMINILEARGDTERAITYLEDMGKQFNSWDYDRLVRLFVAQGDLDKAVEYLRRSAGNYGASAYRYTNIIQRMVQYGMWESAEQYYLDNLSAVSFDTNVVRQFHDVALQHFSNNGRFKDAIVEQYRRLDERQRKPLAMSIRQRARGDSRRVGELLEALLEIDPESEELLSALAQYRRQNRAYKEEVIVLERLISVNADDPDYRWRLSQALKAVGREADAVNTLKTWLDEKPDHKRLELFTRLLKEFERLYMLEQLRDHYLALAEEDSRERWAKLFETGAADTRTGRAQTSEEQHESLREAFEKKDNGPAFTAYINDLIAQEEMDEAAELYEANRDKTYVGDWRRTHNQYAKLAVHQEDTDELLAVYWNALVYRQSGRGTTQVTNEVEGYFRNNSDEGKELLAAFEAKVAAEETPPTGVFEVLARIYDNLGRSDEALQAYEALLEKNPRNTRALDGFARVLGKLERYDEQIATLEAIVEASPSNRRSSATIELARAYTSMEAPEKAKAVIDALRSRVADASTSRAIGDYYFNEKDWDAALSEYEHTMRFPNYRNQVAGKIAMCYFNTGREEDALELLDDGTLQGQFNQFWGQLSSEKLSDAGLRELEKRFEFNQRDRGYQTFMANAYYDRGDLTALRAFFETAFSHLPVNYRGQLIHTYSDLIREKECYDELLALGDLSSAPALSRALVGELQDRLSATSDPDTRAALFEPFKEMDGLDARSMMNLAGALRSIDEEASRDWYLKVAENEDTESKDRFYAARMLRQVGGSEAALRVLTQLVAARPSLLAAEATLSFLAEEGSPDSNQAFLEQLEDIARCEAHLDYLRGLLFFHAGDKEKATEILESLEEGSCLTKSEMLRANQLLERAAVPE